MAMHGAAEWRDDYRQAFPHAEAWALAPVPDLTARKPDINIPVLLLWATADALSPMSVAHVPRVENPCRAAHGLSIGESLVRA